MEGSIRKPTKKAIRFSLMIAGQSGLGKTTLLATLFDPQLQPPTIENGKTPLKMFSRTNEITNYSFELETEAGVRLSVEAWDTPGYNDDVAPETQANLLLSHIESTFDEMFEEEQRIHRNPKFQEHRVHALLYLFEPTSAGLKKFDVDFMKTLAPRVNIIPVIAKADGMDAEEKIQAKKLVREELIRHEIKCFDFSNSLENDGQDPSVLKELLPFTVIGSSFPHGPNRGRQYSWGFVDVDDARNCDLSVLHKIILSIARDDLKDCTEDSLYEQYRTEKLLRAQIAN